MRQVATLWMILWMAGLAHAQPATGSTAVETKPSRSEQKALLGAMQQYAATYTSNLPNFTATLIIDRRTDPTYGAGRGGKSALIEEQLSIVDRRETHKVVKVNGRAVTGVDETALGQFSRGEFGNLLAAILNSDVKADFAWDRTATLNGRWMQVFTFKVPADHGYELEEEGHTIRVAFQGQVWADAQSSAVMRVQFSCVNIPSKSHFKAVDVTVVYKPTQVAGKTYILPSQSRLHARTDTDITQADSEYKSYRRFASESTLVFEESVEPTDGSPPPVAVHP